jgi:hypothetical protein
MHRDEAPQINEEVSEEELIRQRNEWLEATLNPDGKLPIPEVVILDSNFQRYDSTLPADLPMDGNCGSIYLKVPGRDNSVADMVLGMDPSLSNKVISTDVSAVPEYRGKGYGKRLYLEGLKALPLNYGLASHSLLSEDAERIWTWLVDSGVAKHVDRPVTGQIGQYETVF